MVCRNFILPETAIYVFSFSIFQFAQLIVPYPVLSDDKLNASIRELQPRIADLKELLAGGLTQERVGDTKET